MIWSKAYRERPQGRNLGDVEGCRMVTCCMRIVIRLLTSGTQRDRPVGVGAPFVDITEQKRIGWDPSSGPSVPSLDGWPRSPCPSAQALGYAPMYVIINADSILQLEIEKGKKVLCDVGDGDYQRTSRTVGAPGVVSFHIGLASRDVHTTITQFTDARAMGFLFGEQVIGEGVLLTVPLNGVSLAVPN